MQKNKLLKVSKCNTGLKQQTSENLANNVYLCFHFT